MDRAKWRMADELKFIDGLGTHGMTRPDGETVRMLLQNYIQYLHERVNWDNLHKDIVLAAAEMRLNKLGGL